MALAHTPIDIPILSLNQTPPDHAGPNGRLVEAKNVVATQYIPGDGRLPSGGARIKIQQRHGFSSLTTDATSPVDASPVTVPWSNPGLLTTLAREPLSVADSVPRVGTGFTWTGYTDKRVIPNRLEAGVFHTSNHTIQASDDAYCNGTTCSVWVETVAGQSGSFRTVLMIGFRADNETWLIPPQVLHEPGLNVTDRQCLARVRTNGSVFFVVYNTTVEIVGNELVCNVYDTTGALKATDAIIQNATSPSTGYWDIICTADGKLQLVQPNAAPAIPAGTTDVHVQFTTFAYSSGTITITSASDTTVHCGGPCAWLTNDLTSSHNFAYLATQQNGHGIRLYQVENRAQTHALDLGVAVSEPDSLIGFVQTGLALDQPDFYVAWTNYAAAQTVGPKFDPACRRTFSYKVTWANSIQQQRINNSVLIQSRAFKVNDDYVFVSYYQSGSGQVITQQSQTVTWTSGDYMIGQGSQPVSLASGGFTTGSTQNQLGQSIVTTAAAASQNILNTDKVESVVASGLGVVPDGTALLKWTLGNQPLGTLAMGGLLRIAGATGIPSANGDWLLITLAAAGPSSVYYTRFANESGGTVVPGTFTAAGTSVVVSLTYYNMFELDQVYDSQTATLLDGGSMVVSGNATSANNGTKTIYHGLVGGIPAALNQGKNTVSILTGSETTSNSGFTATVTPLHKDRWDIIAAHFSDAMATSGLDHFITVGDDPFTVGTTQQNNAGSYKITSVTSSSVADTDGDAIVAQVFRAPLPTITIDLADPSQAFHFKLQSLTVDYTFQGATVVITDAANPDNNGSYRITQINDDNTFYAFPIDGRTGQTTESFANTVTITIFFATNINPVFQPCWFLTPLKQEVKQAHVGRFEYMTAYADWRFEGESSLPVNMFLTHVTSPVRVIPPDPTDPTGWRFVLPYRAQSFTSAQALVTQAGQVVSASTTIRQNTIGLKQFDLRDSPGLALPQADELLLPGPLSGRFTASGFTEDGIMIGPETPFIVSQGSASNATHLTPKTTRLYQVVFEVTDENGDRIYSIPSPTLSVTLTGTNNKTTIGFRAVQALDSLGSPTDNVYGLSNHKLVGISVYATAILDGVPTTRHFKITNDLIVNGLAPINSANDSGFIFPDTLTTEYVDTNPDADIQTGEVLYTDKGYLPRFPAPAFSAGCIWKNRPWVIGYDGSVWMGGERTEGDAAWFFPAFRFDFADLRAVQCQPMDEYLIVFCSDRSIWYIPSPNLFPDATGRNGTLPTPVRLPMTNGCTGFAVPIHSGVAYSSTAGGVWLIRRDLTNAWLSQPIQTVLDRNVPVTAMAVDQDQRLYVLTGTSGCFVYDQVIGCWYQWALSTASASLATVVDGTFYYQDNSRVARLDKASYADVIGGTTFAVPPDFTLANLEFANIRGLKKVWEFQIVGTYMGPHRLNVVLSYPDEESAPDTTFQPYTPVNTAKYIIPFNPNPEEAAAFKVRIFADFNGVTTPGNSFEIEQLSAEVGTDTKPGIAKTTNRITT